MYCSEICIEWPGGRVPTQGRRFPGSKPDSTKEMSCKWAGCTPNTSGLKLVWRGSLERGLVAQVSSTDHGSKLRGAFQNSPRVASNRDANITKMMVITRIFDLISSLQITMQIEPHSNILDFEFLK
ncbi:hypothetical protein AVEN_14301-1 [Araneus ventricosus]|uniref:Uncharacterized protein n=1 Tax=Araneus ventricosus TaxID=182803 RepID=A0A4Y2JZY8_ARAVE|nr:hypothetical protein AVEN_14301-1 [Araneus ventricosus]